MSWAAILQFWNMVAQAAVKMYLSVRIATVQDHSGSPLPQKF